MKLNARIILILFFFTLASFSCSSLGRQEEQPEAVVHQEVSENRPEIRLPAGWKHETEITHEGSRSEGSISRLFFRYNEIPPVFERMIIGRHIFEYVPMVNIWDNSGYINTGEADTPLRRADELVNSGELKRGWYESPAGVIKKATPPEWIYAAAGEISVWISAEKIDVMISIYNLSPIQSAGMLLNPVPADN